MAAPKFSKFTRPDIARPGESQTATSTSSTRLCGTGFARQRRSSASSAAMRTSPQETAKALGTRTCQPLGVHRLSNA